MYEYLASETINEAVIFAYLAILKLETTIVQIKLFFLNHLCIEIKAKNTILQYIHK